MRESQLPPALRKPVSPTAAPDAPASSAPTPAPTPELQPSKKLDGWEPIPTPKELGLKPVSPLSSPSKPTTPPSRLPAALRPQTPRPPTLGSPASTPKPQPKPGENPKPKFTGGTITVTRPATTPRINNPRIANLDRLSLFEGTFTPEGGKPFTVETPLTGNGAADKASLVALARRLCPEQSFKLNSTRIFTREHGAPATFPVGATMGQLFGESGSDTEVGIEIGSVFFQGERCQVTLRNLRSRNCVTVALRPPGGGQIVFSNQIAANRLAKDLAYVVKEILDKEARELEITLKEAR